TIGWAGCAATGAATGWATWTGCAATVAGWAAGAPSARAGRADGPERVNKVVKAIVATMVLILTVRETVNVQNSLIGTRARIAPCDPFHATPRGFRTHPGPPRQIAAPASRRRGWRSPTMLATPIRGSTENPDLGIPE